MPGTAGVVGTTSANMDNVSNRAVVLMAEPDSNPTQGFGASRQQLGDWETEAAYWRENCSSRPYATADRDFSFYSPGYRYGFESAHKLRGKEWTDAESDLRGGWEKFEHRGSSTWDNMKEAVRDGWNRIAHRA